MASAWLMGVLLAIASFAYICWKAFYDFILQPKLNQPLPDRIRPPILPDKVIARLLRLDRQFSLQRERQEKSQQRENESGDGGEKATEEKEEQDRPFLPLQEEHAQSSDASDMSSEGESACWFNALHGWLFRELRNVPAMEEMLRTDLAEIVVDLCRTPVGAFILKSKLEEYDNGTSMPTISNICLLQEVTEESSDAASDLAIGQSKDYGKEPEESLPLAFGMDFNYDGGVAMVGHYKCIFDWQIFLYGKVRSVTGRMLLVFQKNALYIGFHDRLETAFDSRVVVNGLEFGLLNWICAKGVAPWLFRERFAIPNLKGKWLMDKPEQPPYPWEEPAMVDPSLLYTWKPSPKTASNELDRDEKETVPKEGAKTPSSPLKGHHPPASPAASPSTITTPPSAKPHTGHTGGFFTISRSSSKKSNEPSDPSVRKRKADSSTAWHYFNYFTPSARH